MVFSELLTFHFEVNQQLVVGLVHLPNLLASTSLMNLISSKVCFLIIVHGEMTAARADLEKRIEYHHYYSIGQNIFPQLQLNIVFGVCPFLWLIAIVAPQELHENSPNKFLKASTTGSKSFLSNSPHLL